MLDQLYKLKTKARGCMSNTIWQQMLYTITAWFVESQSGVLLMAPCTKFAEYIMD